MTLKTSLHSCHLELGATMVSFAGFDMPIHYPTGIKEEHIATRTSAGIFDVSHMGQAIIEGSDVAQFFMNITPSAFAKTPASKAKYTVLTNPDGGIIDDVIITKITEDRFFIVFNAACKSKDIAWMKQHLPHNLTFTELDNRSLIAIQGPKAVSALEPLFEGHNLAQQEYMSLAETTYNNNSVYISRLGYTGEDGFEISIANEDAPTLWNTLLENDNVNQVGLGARDTLRLEAGYPLYGQDLDDTTTPIEAGLSWVVRKKDHQFIGGDIIAQQRERGTSRKRVGIELLDKGIVRANTPVENQSGVQIGTITSGGFGPTVNKAIAQGYVQSDYCNEGTEVIIPLRGRKLLAKITNFAFITPNTKT